MGDDRIGRAVATSLPYWTEEFAIGYRAFAADISYRDTGWLAIQIAKEWTGSGVYGPAGVDVASAHADAPPDKLAEELSHHSGLVAMGRVMEAAPPAAVANPAGDALVALRNRLWPDPVARLAVAMSEGGGLGLFKGALAAIADRKSARPQDGHVARCFEAIIADEAGHVAAGFADFASAKLTESEEQATLEHLDAILTLKVAERRVQFAPQLAASASDPRPEAVAAYRAFAIGRFSAP